VVNLADHLDLAYQVARVFSQKTGLPESAVLAEALVALIVAGSQFDPAAGIPFAVHYRRLAYRQLRDKLRKWEGGGK
jgi:hypothetical protein